MWATLLSIAGSAEAAHSTVEIVLIRFIAIEPDLGVSSLDLGRSPAERPFFMNPPDHLKNCHTSFLHAEPRVFNATALH
ncbi:MAG: hypothetical protein CTY31_10990 [Hyphomicrobium sp.]|nr:MAG: hypothetical protein CTY39_07395 [Hyphomicrobium sp.]PPC98947.1 MAG: hypothetical protein CTY31_10990 [Hyphomicrobium sp.]